ncbi:NAD(P)H-dependent oxidoreductase subunit E [Marinitenerispora sediminis]|uniref:NADH-quinone oxidoreductase subunit E n=1 Tax=Marinitenerispora sediminis TaxID=1931232 RepID=A0A368T4D1_9ACTN|nr:NAD(P)H-dependent oxidoreductase subunit E [Marinitenerispora sediminis]RCV49311.1 NADH-quinone oxidoreductase subunit E [Marinitenerispora sediminis]RCV52333.1 NADH-quinone oxidoreductase subunit E [Marinitenerispora sediminis]RCV58240.1 NADH-quinone oxidoreductase subunit E [Marinitenerispora sediminis]
MDLRFLDAPPTDAERDAVDAVLGPAESGWDGGRREAADLRYARGGHAARDRRDLLLPALHAVNDRVGWISPAALDYICRRLTVPPAEAYGVATFYAMFAVHERPRRVVHVCTDIACAARGADRLRADLAERAGPPGGTGSEVVWHESPCLGLCERAPAALALEAGAPPRYAVAAPATAADLDRLTGAAAAPDEGPAGTGAHGSAGAATFASEPAAGGRAEPPAHASVPQAGEPGLVLLRRIGVVDPESLDDYRANGGYAALRRALRLGPAGVIREVLDSGLVGRGGAAFPTGRKWEGTARQPDTPHYLVCNADESEPGTFKDRVVMEGDPFSVIEAMTVAGYATAARKGYLYIRGEYPRALSLLENAIARARERNLLGRDILGSGFDFDIEIRRGAGAYICGEETAIFNSIEGRRGEPRSKPPFPIERGLFGKPTTINNVETLVNVLPILLMGGPAYAGIGTGRSTGPKLFCVSGTVRRPGVYELPFGATLRELVTLAGGTPDGRPPRAVLLGGAAGGFVRGDELDIPLTFEGAREAGATLGSGVVLVLDDTVDLPAILVRIAAFFRDESCGQCVPCRVGTVRQEEALHRLSTGAGARRTDLELLRDVGAAMRDASICGLGQTAWNAVESAIDRLGVFGAEPAAAPAEAPSPAHAAKEDR